jgi:hypothetical protein
VNQAELLRYVIDVLESQRLIYMIVGSFASSMYGAPRLTHNIDIVVGVAAHKIDRLSSAFPAPEFYVSASGAWEAVQLCGQFDVIHASSGNKIHFIMAQDDAWGRSQVERRRRQPIFAERQAFVATPEDVILAKLQFYRETQSEKHLRDIAGILQVSGDEIDVEYINRWLAPLRVAREWQMILDRLKGELGAR